MCPDKFLAGTLLDATCYVLLCGEQTKITRTKTLVFVSLLVEIAVFFFVTFSSLPIHDNGLITVYFWRVFYISDSV